MVSEIHQCSKNVAQWLRKTEPIYLFKIYLEHL